MLLDSMDLAEVKLSSLFQTCAAAPQLKRAQQEPLHKCTGLFYSLVWAQSQVQIFQKAPAAQ